MKKKKNINKIILLIGRIIKKSLIAKAIRNILFISIKMSTTTETIKTLITLLQILQRNL